MHRWKGYNKQDLGSCSPCLWDLFTVYRLVAYRADKDCLQNINKSGIQTMPGKTVKEEEETSWKLLIMLLIFFCPVKVFNTECQNIMFKIFQWSLYTSALLYTATTSYCRSTLWKSHLAKQFLHPKWVIQLKLSLSRLNYKT